MVALGGVGVGCGILGLKFCKVLCDSQCGNPYLEENLVLRIKQGKKKKVNQKGKKFLYF